MAYASGFNQPCINLACDGAGGGLVPACVPGPGTSAGAGPGGLTYSNVLFRLPNAFATASQGPAAPGDPFALDDIVVDVETSTLEAGAVLIDRTPYGLGGGVPAYTYTIGAVTQAVNPNDANLTRFTFPVTGTWGDFNTDLLIAIGVQNPSGGIGFAGYVTFRGGPPA